MAQDTSGREWKGHTPGPWYVAESIAGEDCWVRAKGAGIRSICSYPDIIADYNSDNPGDDDANAALIAAAPSLATENAALKARIGQLEGVLTQAALELEEAANIIHSSGLHGSASLFSIAAKVARAALARGKDES